MGKRDDRKGMAEMTDEKHIPVEWIQKKFILSGRYHGTITETGAKVILRYWKEYCQDQAEKERQHGNR